jgi:hypothetical protein
MKPQYERISWGWIAYTLHDGHLIRGRGPTKREALSALKQQLFPSGKPQTT